jgi:hypothetical protein
VTDSRSRATSGLVLQSVACKATREEEARLVTPVEETFKSLARDHALQPGCSPAIKLLQLLLEGNIPACNSIRTISQLTNPRSRTTADFAAPYSMIATPKRENTACHLYLKILVMNMRSSTTADSSSVLQL